MADYDHAVNTPLPGGSRTSSPGYEEETSFQEAPETQPTSGPVLGNTDSSFASALASSLPDIQADQPESRKRVASPPARRNIRENARKRAKIVDDKAKAEGKFKAEEAAKAQQIATLEAAQKQRSISQSAMEVDVPPQEQPFSYNKLPTVSSWARCAFATFDPLAPTDLTGEVNSAPNDWDMFLTVDACRWGYPQIRLNVRVADKPRPGPYKKQDSDDCLSLTWFIGQDLADGSKTVTDLGHSMARNSLGSKIMTETGTVYLNQYKPTLMHCHSEQWPDSSCKSKIVTRLRDNLTGLVEREQRNLGVLSQYFVKGKYTLEKLKDAQLLNKVGDEYEFQVYTQLGLVREAQDLGGRLDWLRRKSHPCFVKQILWFRPVVSVDETALGPRTQESKEMGDYALVYVRNLTPEAGLNVNLEWSTASGCHEEEYESGSKRSIFRGLVVQRKDASEFTTTKTDFCVLVRTTSAQAKMPKPQEKYKYFHQDVLPKAFITVNVQFDPFD
ncbi:hypothetical protein Q9189_004546 [Teloschistes chrysophthalmus]